MNIQTIVSIFMVLTLVSCDNSRIADTQKPEVPKALEVESSSVEIVSKRGYGDLVESLYNELVEKTPELKLLENRIDDLSKNKADSTEAFKKYTAKNQSYFYSANEYVDLINDSLLKGKIRDLVTGSLSKYDSSISRHNSILKSIDARNSTLNDLHTILKITRTLPLIEKYQKGNLPTTKSLEGFSKQLDGTIKYADSLSKK